MNTLLIPKPTWSGRFGNNIIQLINLLSLGKFKNQDVFIPSNKKYQIRSQIINYTNNDTKKIQHQKEYVLSPFHLNHTKIFRNNIFYNHKKQIIHDLIKALQIYKKPDIFDDLFSTIDNHEQKYHIDPLALYIHIRSTDVYTANNHDARVYSQPPLSFYLKVIEDNNFEKVYILSDDNNNFIIQSLKNIFKTRCNIIIENDPIKAWNILRNCNHLCTSTSSFCTTSIFLSIPEIIKNVYTYNYLTNIFHHWFLSNLFDTENIYNNCIENIKFHIYQIKNYEFMDNCFVNNNLYKNIDDPLWWKNGNEDFQFYWKFDNYTKNTIINHKTQDIVKIL